MNLVLRCDLLQRPVALRALVHEVRMYLQIEEATRLTVRLSERSGHARQTHDFRIKKAGRFRGGASAAVAEVTFGDGGSYLALKDGGIVDMDATMRRLDRMREFIAGLPRGGLSGEALDQTMVG